LENLEDTESFVWRYDEDADVDDDEDGGGGIVRPSYGDVGSGRFLNVDI